MIGAVLYSLINSTVSIYPERAAQGKTLPFATYTVVTEILANEMNRKATISKGVFQVNIRSTTYDQAHSLTSSVINAIDRKSGTIATRSVVDIRVESLSDMFADDGSVFGKTIEGSIWIK